MNVTIFQKSTAVLLLCFFGLLSCSKPLELNEDNVRDLFIRINQASVTRDFEAEKSCYAADAAIEIDQGGRNKKSFSRNEYFQTVSKNSKNVTAYTYDIVGLNIEIKPGEAVVKQTIVETTQTPAAGDVRSKTEATYNVRIVRGKPLITHVDAKLIVAQAASPLALSADGGVEAPR
jgi:hypothetical protein